MPEACLTTSSQLGPDTCQSFARLTHLGLQFRIGFLPELDEFLEVGRRLREVSGRFVQLAKPLVRPSQIVLVLEHQRMWSVYEALEVRDCGIALAGEVEGARQVDHGAAIAGEVSAIRFPKPRNRVPGIAGRH